MSVNLPLLYFQTFSVMYALKTSSILSVPWRVCYLW